jgi:tRNA (guanine-N7-)-methyltransferase
MQGRWSGNVTNIMTGLPSDQKRILYGRRRGHKLRPGQKELVDTLLPHLRLALPDQGELDLTTEFGEPARSKNHQLWLEVGFGGGEHLAAQAENNPEVSLIGCEPFENGVASLLGHVENRGLQNIRIHDDDARDVIAALPAQSVSRAFLLFPDPWPKSRHAKRRFISADNLSAVARILKDGGEFRVATDHVQYCRWALSQILRHPDYDWQAERPSDWNQRPGDWPETRYEQKAIVQGRKPVYFRFRRKTRDSA